jgi:hypothetical protein
LYPDAVKEAEILLAGEKDTQERLTRVSALIEGYETPYGLELLSTVHWVVVHDAAAGGRDKFNQAVVNAVHASNDHKLGPLHRNVF